MQLTVELMLITVCDSLDESQNNLFVSNECRNWSMFLFYTTLKKLID